MTLTLKRYGRYYTSAEADYGQITANNSRSCVFDAASEDMWAILGGFVGGKDGGSSPAVRMTVYDTDASKNPRTRVGYIAPVTASTSMVAAGGGAHYTANVSHSDNGPTDAGIMLYSGSRYAIDLIPTQPFGHSMLAAASITADNEQFYNRTAPSNPPPSAYGAYSASVEGHLTAYLQGYRNDAPNTPTNVLAPSGSVTSTTPTFTANFDDINGTWGTANSGYNSGDQLNQYRIQCRLYASPYTVIWDTPYTASAAEKAADAVSQAYGGSVLTRGVTYEWRIKMSDAFGTYSSYSAWTSFTPASLGYVTLDDVPTGKQESVTPAFNGRWNHQTATTMKTVMVRIKSSSGTLLQTGSDYNIADVASSALPGTLFTIPWASSGLTTLSWATSYRYEINGYDGTVWSGYSTYRTFATNAAPTVPVLSTPVTSTITTAYPLLTFTMSDADDTTATGLTGVIRITQPSTATVDVTPTYNATTLKWEYQTTVTQISAFGVYSWKATGYDGTLYSGEAAALGSATWSSSNTFDYENGPVVTVSAPADISTITTASATVTWTAAGQVKYQVIVYADSTSTIVYDTGLVTSAVQSINIPSGYLRNGVSYDIVVSVTNATPLTGTSSIVNIAVAFTPATDVTNFQVNTVSIGNDAFDTSIRLTWDQTSYAAPDFQEYIIYRSAGGGPDADEIILTRITSPSVVQFIDYTPASGYEYTYRITVNIVTGIDSLESTGVSGTATVTLAGTVMTLVRNGGTYRACLLNVRERDFDRQIQEAVYQSLAAKKPVSVRSVARRWDGAYEGAIISDTTASASARWAELEALDAQQGTVCIRDGRQRKRFCKIADLKQTDEKTNWFSFQFTAREELASEGVV